MRVWRGIVVPIVGRTPRTIAIRTQAGVNKRSTRENRLDNVLGTIDVGRTDNLYIAGAVCRYIGNDSGHILIYIVGQNSLNQEYVVVTANGLQYTQIIDIAIAIQVEVGEHDRRVVEQELKLLYRIGLSECSSHGLQVEVIGIAVRSCNIDGCSRFGRCMNRSGIGRSGNNGGRSGCHNRRCRCRSRRNRENTCDAAAQKERSR